MKTPGPQPLPDRFDPLDDTATKPASTLYEPPDHASQSAYLYRWWGARYLLATEACIDIVGLMTPRQMFIIHFRMEGLTTDQIASRMQLTPNAIHKNISRLRQRIYEELPNLRLRLIYCYHYRHPLDPRGDNGNEPIE